MFNMKTTTTFLASALFLSVYAQSDEPLTVSPADVFPSSIVNDCPPGYTTRPGSGSSMLSSLSSVVASATETQGTAIATGSGAAATTFASSAASSALSSLESEATSLLPPDVPVPSLSVSGSGSLEARQEVDVPSSCVRVSEETPGVPADGQGDEDEGSGSGDEGAAVGTGIGLGAVILAMGGVGVAMVL
ncbi:hypothetical protein BDV98DRAFT_607317 [Pterulicium gracile]|uniref:GPI anchored protein n=1 Tax=Pterulicium gracile TaxID=1884261 RepID=A0A5C3Q9J7_9AGAR|nr:hypothetical protein BDV98DRAFT_607317 [Pterula gracilis]